MAEFRPEMCTEAAQQGLMQWLLKRLKVSIWESFGSYHNKNWQTTGLEDDVLQTVFGTILKAQGYLLLALSVCIGYICVKF